MRVTSLVNHVLVTLSATLCLAFTSACDEDPKCGTATTPCSAGGSGGSGGSSGTAGMSGTGGSGGSGGTAGTGGTSGSGGSGGTAGTGGTSGSGGSGGTAGTGGAGGAAGTGGAGGAGGCAEPLDEPIENCRPTAPASTGDLAQDCVNRINQLRAECQCLPPLMRWTEGEACADEQAEYDAARDDPHAGFSDGICESGSGQNECPGWGSERQTITGCLQQMWDEGPGEPFSEHGHYINMTNPDHDRVACGFFTTAGGEVWAVQNFR